MAKRGNRVQVILECTEHKTSGVPGTSRYITTKNKRNTPDRMELKKFNPELLKKERVVAISKCDMLDDELISMMKKDLKSIKPLFISGVSGLNLQPLKDLLWDKIEASED